MKRRYPTPRLSVETLESRITPVTAPPGFEVVPVVSEGLGFVTAVTAAPDGRVFVAQKNGYLRVVENGVLLPGRAVAVPSTYEFDRGLLGIALDPDFENNHFIYLSYSAYDAVNGDETRTSRFVMDGNTADPASEKILLRVPTPQPAHVAGMIQFGPDGKLYVSTGDNGFFEECQRIDNLYGKLLRINSDGTIPEDNPFYTTAAGVNRAIYALGFRNPFTFAFQPGTGRLYVNDVGQNSWEEINEVVPGGNYGWPRMEGPDGLNDPAFIPPVLYYGHPPLPDDTIEGLGNAISGGVFYNPTNPAFPAEYVGQYLYADINTGWIRAFDPATKTSRQFISGIGTGTTANALLGLALDADGNLVFGFYNRDTDQQLYKLVYTPPASPPGITQHPADRVTNVGQPVTFSVAATGSGTLTYQWQRDGEDIDGATAATYTLPQPAAPDSGAVFRVVVRNDAGSATSNGAKLVVNTNTNPTAVLLTPKATDQFTLGGTVGYSGLATDREEGSLPPSAYGWKIYFVTGGVDRLYHTQEGGASGSFVLPDTSVYDDVDVQLRVVLTVTDGFGSTGTASVTLSPKLAPVTIGTNFPGLNATTLGGQPFTGSVNGVVGFVRKVGALPEVTLNGERYRFIGWSDGGAAVHDVPTPAGGIAITAQYRKADPVVFGNGVGGAPLVQVRQPGSGTVNTFPAFELSFTGGVRVATGDINGDGVPDIVAAAGPGGGPRVRIFDGRTLGVLADFFAFEASFTGGLFVAVADVNGDFIDDVVFSPDVGGGPRVRVLAGGDPKKVLADFFAIDDVNYRGGTSIALGDVSGNGRPDLVVGASTDGPRVVIYDGSKLTSAGVGPTPPKLVADFFAFDPAFPNGVSVALGDVNGDGYADLITGPGKGGGPRVVVIDGRSLTTGGGNRAVLQDFFAGDPNARNGVRVAAVDIDGGGADSLVAANTEPTKLVNAYVWDSTKAKFAAATSADVGPVGIGWNDIYVG